MRYYYKGDDNSRKNIFCIRGREWAGASLALLIDLLSRAVAQVVEVKALLEPLDLVLVDL